MIIRRQPHDDVVKAHILRLSGRWARRLIVQSWWTGLPVPVEISSREKDQEWDWEAAVSSVEDDWNFGCYAAVTVEKGRLQAQGAIFYERGARSPSDPENGAVYLKLLASAPRNRTRLVGNQAVYRGTGTELAVMAMLDSVYDDCEGRVFCKALPESVSFYEDLNFKTTMDMPSGRMYYEIPTDHAKAHLLRRRWL